MLKRSLNLAILVVFCCVVGLFVVAPSFVYADPSNKGLNAPAGSYTVRHGTITDVTGSTITILVTVTDPATGKASNLQYSATPTNFSEQSYGLGKDVYFVTDASGLVVNSKVSTQPFDLNVGFSSELFNVYCPTDGSLSCWIAKVYEWSTGALFILSVGAVIYAGITWMTAYGNPARVTYAKKVLIGAFSAVLVIVLGRIFLTNILGIKWL